MKKLILAALISCGVSSYAERIFQCMQPVNLDDPNFQQGSELFFDIHRDKEKGLKIIFTKGSYETEVFLSEGSESSYHLDMNDGSLAAEWKEPASITLVLRDFGHRWYGGFWFSDGLKTKLANIPAGRDIHISCVERASLE